MKKDIIVIGAGAAGLMAAAAASDRGCRVTVLERNEKAGKKIYITGKGRCNLTNDCATEDFFAFVARNHKFLYSAVYGFDHDRVKEYFEKNGCPVKVERGNRVFPVSDHASDVTAALVRDLQRKGVRIRYRTRVTEILTEEEGPEDPGRKETAGTEKPGRKKSAGPRSRICGVMLEDGTRLRADAVVLCTGGLSYPSTGSTGDGLRMARRLGLTVTETAPSLVPFETKDQWCRDLQGLALKNVSVKVFPANAEDRHMDPAGDPSDPSLIRAVPDGGQTVGSDNKDVGQIVGPEKTGGDPAAGPEKNAGAGKSAKKKKASKKPVYEAFGELLFTHFGLSGPIILTASCYCDFLKYPQGFRLLLDLKPALSRDQLEERLRREFAAAPDRHLPGAVRPLFPARLAEAVTGLSGLGTGRRAASFTDAEIRGLAALIKAIPVTVTGTRGYNEAIVTRGGISVREFDPSTMECRRIRGLYAAGEVLDVDAQTGGFNLQIAWSTGRLAGESIQ